MIITGRVKNLCVLLATLLLSHVAYGQTRAPGLVAAYLDGVREVIAVVATPHFSLERDESIHPQITPAFSVKWRGFIEILLPGRYRFSVAGNAPSFRIDGKAVLDRWIDLNADLHAIELEYTRGPDAARVHWTWESEYFAIEPLPARRLYHDAADSRLPAHGAVEAGRALALSLGCANCHAGAPESGMPRLGPDLSTIGARATSAWLNGWLIDPSRFRPHATMPVMLSAAERADVVAYLSSLDGASFPAMGSRGGPHDVAKGRQHYWALGCAACHEQEALRLGALGSKTSAAALAQYLLDPSVVNAGGTMPDMMLTRIEAEQLAWFLLQTRDARFEAPAVPGNPQQGRALVLQRGCLACHTLDDVGPLKNAMNAPPMGGLEAGRGCLADETPLGLPRYMVTPRQHQDLGAFVASQQSSPDQYPAPVYAFHQRLDQLHCAACHTYQNHGPSVAISERAPDLSESGAKLQEDWIRGVLEGEHRIRPWFRLRMPRFPERTVSGLAEGFAKALGVVDAPDPQPAATTDAQAVHGLDLIGSDGVVGGLACLNCHDWGAHASLGERGPQLKDAARRVRYPWFRRWLLQPSRIQPGTAMPTYFADLGPDQASAEIDSLWAALSRAEDLPPPAGLGVIAGVAGSEEMPLPRHEAIVIRWYMPEASPAAIAVGMPGGISYCFDATSCRLLYAWAGGFVDMTPTLAKPAPPARIVGEVFYRSDAHPLAEAGSNPETSFQGYRIVDGYPRFHYFIDGVEVFERVIPAESGDGITREFQLHRVHERMSFQAHTSSDVTLTATVGELEAGTVTLPTGTDIRFDVTVMRNKDLLFDD